MGNPVHKLHEGVKQLPVFFGVSFQLINEAASLGAVINYTVGTSKGVSVEVVSSDGACFNVIPIAGQAITLAKMGKLGPASKQAVQYQIEGALNKVIIYEKGKDPKSVVQVVPSNNVEPVVIPPTVKEIKSVKQNDVVGEVVQLKDAVSLHQKVSGTSAGSVYVVVAILDGAAMAVRWKNGTLSVRVEGSKLKSYEEELKDLGFLVKPNYGSVHFDIKQESLLCKTMGAIIGRIGFDKVKSVCNVMEVVGHE
jgi:hypothetical protein